MRGRRRSIVVSSGPVRPGPSGGTDPAVLRGMHELIERQARQMAFLAAGLLDAGRMNSGHLFVRTLILESHLDRTLKRKTGRIDGL